MSQNFISGACLPTYSYPIDDCPMFVGTFWTPVWYSAWLAESAKIHGVSQGQNLGSFLYHDQVMLDTISWNAYVNVLYVHCIWVVAVLFPVGICLTVRLVTERDPTCTRWPGSGTGHQWTYISGHHGEPHCTARPEQPTQFTRWDTPLLSTVKPSLITWIQCMLHDPVRWVTQLGTLKGPCLWGSCWYVFFLSIISFSS